ncbi:MAG: hypothetical protein M3Q36_02875, partial [bacterium]|nr:hypothetical protein [bacterium]
TGSIEPSPTEDLYPSWYQKKGDNNERRTIDIVSGKLATECTPELAKSVESGGTAQQFSGDTFVGGSATTSNNEKDDVHQCTDERPSVVVSVTGDDGTYTLRANASPGTHPLTSADRAGVVNFKVNGQTISGGSVSVSKAASGVTYSPASDGNAAVTAEIIDSVLYSSTSSAVNMNFEASSQLSLSYTAGAVTIDFNWSGNKGQVTLFRQDNNDEICEGGDCNDVSKISVPSGTTVYAQDNSGTSSPITVTYP